MGRAKRNPSRASTPLAMGFAALYPSYRATGTSLPQPLRRTLLRKRLRPLDVILRGRHRLYGGVLPLLGDRLFQRHFEPALDRLLGGTDRHRRILGNRLGPALGR